METNRQVIASYADEPVHAFRVDELWAEHVNSHQAGRMGSRSSRRTPVLIAVTVIIIALTVGVSTSMTSRVTTQLADTPLAMPSCAAQRQVVTKVYQGSSPTVTSKSEVGGRELFVPDSPTAALICHYYPMNTPHVGTLESHRKLDAGEAANLAALFDAGSIEPRPLPIMYCAADYEDMVITTFFYNDMSEPSVEVAYNRTSCRLATTGRATSATTVALQQEVDSLVG